MTSPTPDHTPSNTSRDMSSDMTIDSTGEQLMTVDHSLSTDSRSIDVDDSPEVEESIEAGAGLGWSRWGQGLRGWRRRPRPRRADWPMPGRPGSRPGSRGMAGAGGGRATSIAAPPEFLSTSVQACGLFPWIVGGASPVIGAPLGLNLLDGASTVCYDPISWFQASPRLCSTPSLFVLGLPHKGKSTAVAHMVTGMAAGGAVPLFLGDLKPDYAELTRRLGSDGTDYSGSTTGSGGGRRSQVITVTSGQGVWNPLRPGNMFQACARLLAAAATAAQDGDDARAGELRAAGLVVQAEAVTRQMLSIEALIHVSRGRAVGETEENGLAAALTLLNREFGLTVPPAPSSPQAPPPDAPAPSDTTGEGGAEGVVRQPLIADLVAIFEARRPQVEEAVYARGSEARYFAAIDPLLTSLKNLTSPTGKFGAVFARPTSEQMDLDAAAVCVDISRIRSNPDLLAAVLLATWAEGFAMVEARQALADAGLEKRSRYVLVLDEIWKSLAGARGMVDRVDELTRLNRTMGIANVMITHSIRDLQALDPADQVKAVGFVERSGALLIGALPRREFIRADAASAAVLTEVYAFTRAEIALVTSWADPQGDTGEGGGLGNFLLKVGNAPGTPFHVQLTSLEGLDVLNTNTRWTPEPATAPVTSTAQEAHAAPASGPAGPGAEEPGSADAVSGAGVGGPTGE